jgi:hypothetical protein
MKYFIGIDYSISSPAITIYHDQGKKFNFSNVSCYFFNKLKRKSFIGIVPNILEISYPSESGFEKYISLAAKILDVISFIDPKDCIIAIEGYSMNSVGKVFHIAENCAVLKYFLISNGYTLLDSDLCSPTSIKKFTTGKGNAKKDKMYECFVEETSLDILNLLEPSKQIQNSFVADIVDSYYICKYCHSLSISNKLQDLT